MVIVIYRFQLPGVAAAAPTRIAVRQPRPEEEQNRKKIGLLSPALSRYDISSRSGPIETYINTGR